MRLVGGTCNNKTEPYIYDQRTIYSAANKLRQELSLILFHYIVSVIYSSFIDVFFLHFFSRQVKKFHWIRNKKGESY